MTSHLGLSSGESDVRQAEVTGVDMTFSGRGPYTLSPPYGNFSDRLSPTGVASVAFSGDQGDAGVLLETDTFGSIYLGFGLESLTVVDSRGDLLRDALSFCSQIGVLFSDGFETGDTSRWGGS